MFPLYDDNASNRAPLVVLAIILINVLVTFWMESQSLGRQRALLYEGGFLPDRLTHLGDGRQFVVADPEGGELVLSNTRAAVVGTMFSCLFIHGGWVHLIGNMWFLWIFGNNVEERLGPLRFIAFYLIGGLAATLCHYMAAPDSQVPVVGASGAIGAILGAYAVTWPHAQVRTLVFVVFILIIDVPAFLFLGLWFVQQFVSGLYPENLGMAGGVAWWAHIGGFACGALLMPLLAPRTPEGTVDVLDPRAMEYR